MSYMSMLSSKRPWQAAPLDESTSLRPRVLREARSRLLQRKSSKELLDEEAGAFQLEYIYIYIYLPCCVTICIYGHPIYGHFCSAPTPEHNSLGKNISYIYIHV